MISKRTATLLAGIAVVTMMVGPASATPISAGQVGVASGWVDGNPPVVNVKKKKRRRFRKRRRGFTHFRNGFYYSRPFWDDDDYYEDDYDYDDGDDDDDDDDYDRDRADRGGSHEDWCRRKYRSYKVRTNTWTDFSGNTRICKSPF